MRVRILLQVAPEDGAFGEAEEVATFEKGADRLEAVGLSLAEAKALLGGLQHRLVGLQAAAHVERHRRCEACGKRLRAKGGYPIVFRSLFGDVRLASPRFHRCRCGPAPDRSGDGLAAQGSAPGPRRAGAALPRGPLGLARALRRRGRAARRRPAGRGHDQRHHRPRARAAGGRAGRGRARGGAAVLHRWLPGRLGGATAAGGADRGRAGRRLRPRLEREDQQLRGHRRPLDAGGSRRALPRPRARFRHQAEAPAVRGPDESRGWGRTRTSPSSRTAATRSGRSPS